MHLKFRGSGSNTKFVTFTSENSNIKWMKQNFTIDLTEEVNELGRRHFKLNRDIPNVSRRFCSIDKNYNVTISPYNNAHFIFHDTNGSTVCDYTTNTSFTLENNMKLSFYGIEEYNGNLYNVAQRVVYSIKIDSSQTESDDTKDILDKFFEEHSIDKKKKRKITCRFCHKQFFEGTGMSIHLNKCPKKPKYTSETTDGWRTKKRRLN